MATPKRYSLADVRRSYTSEKAGAELRGELPVYLFYRPLSFPVAWLLLRLRMPVGLVTAAGGALGLGIVYAALSGGPHAYWLVAGLGFAFHVLDCSDGTMARTSGRTTRWGALFDGLCDYVFWSALLFALGVMTEREAAVPFARFGSQLGLACAIVVLLARDVRQHFLVLFGAPAVLGVVQTPKLRHWLLYAFAGLESLYVPAIALGGAFGALHRVLLGVCVYVTAVAGVSIASALGTAAKHDAAAAVSGDASNAPQEQARVLPTERE